MPKLFLYVVAHDKGFAPNPANGHCTLVHCKFKGSGDRRNIVEMTEQNDWIMGIGGKNKESSEQDTIIYMMRVDEKIKFMEFLCDKRFKDRIDCKDFGSGNEFAIISKTFFYFGRNAIPITCLPPSIRNSVDISVGRGYKSSFLEAWVKSISNWFLNNYKPGVYGRPCTLVQAKTHNEAV